MSKNAALKNVSLPPSLTPDPVIASPQVLMLIQDSVIQKLYRQGINSRHFCTVWCEEAGSWTDILAGFNYHVVVVDLSLFPSAPIRTLLEIKKISPESEIIALSNNEDVQIVIDAFKAGVTDFYLTPTPPETLTWAIEKVIARNAFQTNDASLKADLKVFSAAHHISISENASKMRELAIQNLVTLSEAAGGLWVWPENEVGVPRFGLFQGDPTAAETQFRQFHAENKQILVDSFDTHLTSHPEHWYRGKIAWIPLQTEQMGAIFLYGIKALTSAALQARSEFLVRNLEVSLENHRRIIEAKQLTYIDDLTGLYNSRYLEVALSASIDRVGKESDGFCVLFIDIDHFKRVNDTHGHLIGSQMLVSVAKVLKQALRKSDQMFRYGGDEFIGILSNISLKGGIEIAERLRALIEARTFRFPNAEVKVTLSIGIARFPDHGLEKKKIIEMADNAMYQGKKNGRNKVFAADF